MSKGLGEIERKILQYPETTCEDCQHRLKEKKTSSHTDELCAYIDGRITCRCQTESKFFSRDQFTNAVYQSVLRATRSLEKKGYLMRKKYVERLPEGKGGFRWRMSYVYITKTNVHEINT